MSASAGSTSAAILRRSILLAALLACAGCATTRNVQQIETLEASDGEQPTILLMPPDIRYYLVTAGGVGEPHAEWTEAARSNYSTAVQAYAAGVGADLKVLSDADMTPAEIRYRKLHEAVGSSVLLHHFGAAKLPSKDGGFDWSLGSGVNEIGEEHDADYALFTFYRDEQASGGRIALAILTAAAAGVATPAGAEYGFASLVDLRTGDVVWFNIVGAGTGELRDIEGARAAVANLFRDMPSTEGL